MTVATDVEKLKLRVTNLEEVVNKIQTAITNLASLESLRQILLIKQTDMEDLEEELEALTSRVNLIQTEVFK